MTTHISALPPHVTISGSRVYATQGSIYTLDRLNGQLLQSYPIKGVRACVVVDDVLYTYTTYGQGQVVQALHTRDGSQLWSYPAQRLTELPLVVNGIVYASDIGKGCVYAIQAHTGTLLWSYQVGNSLAQPAVSGGVLYISPTVNPPDDAYVYALRARHGSQLWRVRLPEVTGVPLIADNGLVYVCSIRNCHALQGWDGVQIWQHEYAPEGATLAHPVEKDDVLYVGGSVLSRPFLQNGLLYFCVQGIGYSQSAQAVMLDLPQRLCRALYLCALEPRSGRLHWERRLDIPAIPLAGHQELLSPGRLDILYLSTTGGALYALNATDGHELWHYQTSGTILSQAVQADDIVYVGASDGHVYALQADNGHLLWKAFVSTEMTILYSSSYDSSNRIGKNANA